MYISICICMNVFIYTCVHIRVYLHRCENLQRKLMEEKTLNDEIGKELTSIVSERQQSIGLKRHLRELAVRSLYLCIYV